jgi:hypothetical protein
MGKRKRSGAACLGSRGHISILRYPVVSPGLTDQLYDLQTQKTEQRLVEYILDPLF